MTLRVAYITSDWSQNPPTLGGAGWARVGIPAQALTEHGWDVVIASGVGATRRGEILPLGHDNRPLGDGYPLIVLQRWMHRDAADTIRAARAYGQVVVQDIDDWFDGIDPANLAYHSTDPRRSPDANRDHYRRALAASDLITCSTPFLADRMARYAPTVLVRNALDVARWTRQPVRDTSEQLTVGWVGLTPWRSGDLEELHGVLWPWLVRNDARFLHAGHDDDYPAAGPRLGFPETAVYDARPPVPVSRYPGQFQGIDIGIVPLADVPFNIGKSAIKGMENAAAGVPFIASSSPEYREFGVGLLARRRGDWLGHLDRLRDPGERQRIADAAYERVLEWSIDAQWTRWRDTYASLLT